LRWHVLKGRRNNKTTVVHYNWVIASRIIQVALKVDVWRLAIVIGVREGLDISPTIIGCSNCECVQAN